MEELLREGPPYPDGKGRVKCFYCIHLSPAESRCEANRVIIRDGISLLRQCTQFQYRERKQNHFT